MLAEVKTIKANAERGDADQQRLLGDLYMTGAIGECKDPYNARFWYEKSSAQGDKMAQQRLVDLLINEVGGRTAVNRQFVTYMELSVKGNSEAQCDLADCFLCGNGVKADFLKALEWYVKSAEKGYARAQYSLALYYERELKTEEAVAWLLKAAAQGHTESLTSLKTSHSERRDVRNFLNDYYGAGNWRVTENPVPNASTTLPKQDTSPKQVEPKKQEEPKKGKSDQECLFDDYLREMGGRRSVSKEYRDLLQYSLDGDAESQYQLGKALLEGHAVRQNQKLAIEWITKAAKQGYVNAQRTLGKCFEEGIGVTRDYDFAFNWYSKAVKQGDKRALNHLVKYYGNLKDVKNFLKDYIDYSSDILLDTTKPLSKADTVPVQEETPSQEELKQKEALLLFENIRQNAESGSAEAQKQLADYYAKGEVVAKDQTMARTWYEKSASQGNEEAISSLLNIHVAELGSGTAVSQKIIEILSEAIKGNAEAQCQLGVNLLNGSEVGKNCPKGMEWLTKSANQGYAKAQYILGRVYYKGEILTKDYNMAFEWWSKAAEQGHVEAQHNLGIIYARGDGIQSDLKKAVLWISKVARLGNIAALKDLVICLNKTGVEEDSEEAKRVNRLVGIMEQAQQGDAKMQNLLGVYYYKGDFLKVDYSKAFDCFYKAAEQECVNAQFNLGVCYETGNGVARDSGMANEWYAKSGLVKGTVAYAYPPTTLFNHPPHQTLVDTQEGLDAKIGKLVECMNDFGIKIDVGNVGATISPSVTTFEVTPPKGVKVAQLSKLNEDMAIAMKCSNLRCIGNIEGKGCVGYEMGNDKQQIVSMRDALESDAFQNAQGELPVVLGMTTQNEYFVFDMAKTPHLLVAGATGQGKSVGLNVILASLLVKQNPDNLRIVLVDPKMVEFSPFKRLEKRFLLDIAGQGEIITDVDKAKEALELLCVEMDDRYKLLQDAGLRNIKEYNNSIKNGTIESDSGNLSQHHHLPYIVVVVDEFGDLIMTGDKKATEKSICRIAQKARAVGIHLILATQRPSTDVVTGLIKANFPTRIAFKTGSLTDSNCILDQGGADKLIGRGDLLFKGAGDFVRVQCAWVDIDEIKRLMVHIHNQPESVPYCIGSVEGYSSNEPTEDLAGRLERP